ncbi:MAG TPA: FeoA family protein [Anaerolineaceae bacterium]|nr:FeoA family protein [Anaerolineaceae bacterium]
MLNAWNNATTVKPALSTARREISLGEIPAGSHATIEKFDERMPRGQRESLQVYGIIPGQRVRVVQQRPVTVVEVEQTELAFEGEIARWVIVQRD